MARYGDAADRESPRVTQPEAVAAASPHCRFQMLDPDFARWGVSFLPFLQALADGL